MRIKCGRTGAGSRRELDDRRRPEARGDGERFVLDDSLGRGHLAATGLGH